jgi:radical SAM-linked protein
MAYSAGFSPHPRISYANAAPTGAASEAEYVEIAVTRRCDPDRVRVALDAALPPGLDIVEVIEAGSDALADRLQASLWQVELFGVTAQEAERAVALFLAEERVEVQRVMKTGLRVFDARAAVIRAAVRAAPEITFTHGAGAAASGGCAILELVVRHTTPAVRPDDVLAALRSQAQLAPPSPPRMTRLAQGPLDEVDGAVADAGSLHGDSRLLTSGRDTVGA